MKTHFMAISLISLRFMKPLMAVIAGKNLLDLEMQQVCIIWIKIMLGLMGQMVSIGHQMDGTHGKESLWVQEMKFTLILGFWMIIMDS